MAKELDEAAHIWIRSLTDTMDRQQAQRLIDQSRELMDRPEAGYVDAVLQIASKANRKIFDEVKKEENPLLAESSEHFSSKNREDWRCIRHLWI